MSFEYLFNNAWYHINTIKKSIYNDAIKLENINQETTYVNHRDLQITSYYLDKEYSRINSDLFLNCIYWEKKHWSLNWYVIFIDPYLQFNLCSDILNQCKLVKKYEDNRIYLGYLYECKNVIY